MELIEAFKTIGCVSVVIASMALFGYIIDRIKREW